MCIKYIFDEGLGRNLSEGLKLLGKNVEHVLDNFDPATPDEVWLEYAGKNGLALVTKDKGIRSNPNEKALLVKYGVKAFYLGGSEKSGQDIVKQLINAWDTMDATVKQRKRSGRACAFLIRPRGGKFIEIPLT